MYARYPRILAPWRTIIIPPEVSLLSGGTDSGAGAVWPTINLAIYMPFWRNYDAVVTAVKFYCTGGNAASRNYSLGWYQPSTSGNPGARDVVSASTLVAAGINTWTLTTPYVIPAGDLRYFAMSLNHATLAVHRWSQPSVINLRMTGFAQEASAYPLPATATGVAVTNAYLPMAVALLAAA